MRGSMARRFPHVIGLVMFLALVFHASWAASAPGMEAVSVRQLVEVVDFGGLSVSPDGRLIAFRTERASIERNTYDTVWYVQPIDGSSPPRRLGEGGAPLRDTGGVSVSEAAVWSPDGRWIFYRALFDGRVEVWRAAVDGSRTEQVTDDLANVRAFSLSADGAVLNYGTGAAREAIANAELAEYDRGIHIDRTVPLGDNLFRSGYQDGRLASERLVDNELERFTLLSTVPKRWKAIELATGENKSLPSSYAPTAPLAPSDLSPDFKDALKLREDPGSGRIAILLPSNQEDGLTAHPMLDLAVLPGRSARRLVRCTSELCIHQPMTDIAWRPGSDEIVFTVTAPDNAQSIFAWNVASGTVRPVVRSRGQLGGGGPWAPGACGVSAGALACVAADADRPPRLERIDLQSGERSVLFDPNAALEHDVAVSVHVRPVDWTDAKGTRFTGRFYPAKADGHGAPPLFVIYYRCSGFLRGGMGDEWPLAVLAEHGIAVLCINAAPLPKDAIERYEQARAAVEGMVGQLAARGDVDPARVGMGGLSFGAEVSMWTAMNSRMPRAISISTPVASPMARLLFSLWGDVYASRLKRYWQLGSPQETPERWRRLSPAYDPGRVKVPVLMQMPEQEYRSSLDYSLSMIQSHQADVYVFPNERHQKFQPRHKLAVYERNLDWFRFWLQGYVDSDSTKVDQYARWRKMREANAGKHAE